MKRQIEAKISSSNPLVNEIAPSYEVDRMGESASDVEASTGLSVGESLSFVARGNDPRIDRNWEIMVRLEELYGVPEWDGPRDPIEELVACILSQHTSDVNSGRAYARLRAVYPTWEAVMAAPTADLAESIRCGGLADSKAPRIQQVLLAIKAVRGRVSLDFLSGMGDEEARSFLMALPGVGPKTAGIVLCFAMGRNVLPVDTHVFRVSWRLGLITKRLGEAKAHDALQAQILPEMTFRFHMALIRHGRRICKAPVPRCFDCPLTAHCDYYQAEHRKSQAADPDSL